jgi:hypothetical protein
MSGNHSSLKLSSPFVEEARREAELCHRSVGAQVEYWATLGRAIENTPGFSLERVRQAMEGQLRVESLPDAGPAREGFLAEMSSAFDNPDAQTRLHFVALGAREGAVGSDGKGGVLRRHPAADAVEKG